MNLRQYLPYTFAVVIVVVIANALPSGGGQPGGEVRAATTPVSEPGSAPPASAPAPADTVASLDAPPAATSSTVAVAVDVPATTTTTATTPRRTPAPVPLSIVASGYASTTAAVGDPEVPDDGLPVAAAAGAPSKISFVRLTGSDAVLGLVLVDAEEAHRVPELAAVTACPITEAWEPIRGQAMAEAPAHDCADGVAGKRVDDSTFTFDLSPFPERSTGHGFALVAAPDAPAFQVTFSIHTVAGES